MASTISQIPVTVKAFSLQLARGNHAPPCEAKNPKSAFAGRRSILFTLIAAPAALTLRESPSNAEDIPLFGLRKKLKKAEEDAEELVRQGFQTAEKGLETAEKGIVAVEKGIETAEEEIEQTVSFGGLGQAGVVAGAEVFGVLIATSIVNGILGPEAQKS